MHTDSTPSNPSGIFSSLTARPRKSWPKKLMLLALPLAAAVSFIVIGQTTPPSIPAVSLSADPLYTPSSVDKPALSLALSVEYPTVGAQYVDPDNNNSGTSDDPTYSPTIEYLGYYDAESCYTYDDAGTLAPSGQASAYKRFIRRGKAIALSTANTANPTWTSRMCWNGTTSYSKDDGTTPASSTSTNDAFSGNFLNWSSSSAIDMLRLSLTGGDRVIDTATLTVLQRAVIPDGDPISMGNSSNFPAKRLYRTGTSRAITATAFAATSYTSGVPFFGAVPSAMVTAAGTNDIWVANTLNRIYFGTSKTGNNSSGFSSYTLGSAGNSGVYQVGPVANSGTTLQVTAPAYQKGPTSDSSSQPTVGRTYCADRNGVCTLPAGKWEVWYGRDDANGWKVAPASGSVPCTDAVLGNATGGSRKCYYFAYSGPWEPTATATYCADENGTCTLPVGTKQEIWYGVGNTWKVAPSSGNVPCTNGVFGDPLAGTGKKCYYLPYSGTWSPTAATTGLNSDGYFFSRVQVCDRNPSTYALKEVRYWDLCKRYSDGATVPKDNYKPTGAIQKYADQLRLSAFGYLMDQNSSRYGGVLRAPVKYVGAKTFDINGTDNTASGGNPNREWDIVTGVFNPNPDNNTTVPTTDGRGVYLSGVISYLNQFGRTGSVQGRYKIYDPVGELHYQALRYFQGLPPSAAAVSSITTSMYDGFPVAADAATGWTDPYGNGRASTSDYSCLKSNIVVIGDKNTWDYNSRIPAASAADNILDIAGWNSVVSKFESKTAGTYVDGAGMPRTINNPNAANTAGVGGASGDSNISGTAYWARTQDIRGTAWTKATSAGTTGTTLQRPGLRVKTFVFDVNEYGGSNSATVRRTSNQLFRAAKYGGFETDPSNSAKNAFNTKGNPFYRDDMTTADNSVWQDTDTRASRQGEANTYFLQSDARGVLTAFDDIFARSSTAARSIAGGAIQSKNLTQVGNTIYQGTFDTADWTGDLVAIPVSVNSSNVVTIENTFRWTASTVLANRTTARNIVMGNTGASANPVAADFTWATIETTLKTSLNRLNPSATLDNLGEDRLNYLRGDRSKEGTTFRTRTKLMGDVINSGVIFSGKPTTSISDAGYSTFFSANQSRKGAVFVGANDGMLHAFDGDNGNEFFAYIPSWLGSKLSALTSSTYANSHQSYLDGTPAVAEAKVGTDWKTVLVSGTGAGGRGVFALDVTNPETFTKDNVMWEFTNTDDPDLGFVTGRPQILKMRTSASSSATATYKSFAVFGGGVNSYVSDSAGVFSTTGKPTLFILDLSKTTGSAWTLNTNYFKVSLPIDSTLSATLATGLINFRPALSPATQAVTHIFAGDLHGKLWKLDFTTLGTSDWTADKLSYFRTGSNNDGTAMPLFIARDSSGNAQPITAAPNLVFGPDKDSFYVLFGTGKYLELNDRGTTGTQSVYMVYDNATTSVDTTPRSSATAAVSSRLRLKAGSVSTSTGAVTVPTFTIGRATTNTDTDNPRSGWRFDLPNSKERQISNGTVFGDKLIFGSLLPGVTSTNACSASGGGGNQYTVDILNGSGLSVGSSVGILGEPLIAEITSATTYTASDSTGRRVKTITSQVFQQGSDGFSAGSGSNTNTKMRTVITGRLTWRQINNYQDLKNAP